MEVFLKDSTSTRKLGRALGRLVLPGDVIILAGELGAGKTTLAQGLAEGLGVEGWITSPTFTLIQEYRGRCPLYHLDLYRLEDPEEIWDLGLEEYLKGSGVTVVEWGDRLGAFVPERLEIHLAVGPGEGRRARLIPSGERYRELVKELAGSLPGE
ncbi:MAG: tRNA (adenosine(37)-N6)-threonylcarbamoyltransferase complex ATPase subunit type 1 TsaE [Thermoanaerobacteraceae bacterium]|nr:tRNA (adenosine(37)-N6)-threonylcarbamoyltransferase complex ATPase subunit type 1 TsaE [Thermoanaerobacteraceae bacterium]